jgi:hypothetical protein
MNRQRSDEWVARVVAWHNRHPLARRILPAQVQAMGWVRLPFTAPAGARGSTSNGSSRGRGWRAAFTEKFLPPHSPRRIARWALRHAQEAAPELAGSPVREVLLDIRKPNAEAEPVMLWVPTAAIVDGRAQSRVLLAPGAPQQLLGRRLWSLPRLAAVACVALVAVALPSGVGWVSTLHWDDAPIAQDLPPEPGQTLAMAGDAASAPGDGIAPADEPPDMQDTQDTQDLPPPDDGTAPPVEPLPPRPEPPPLAPGAGSGRPAAASAALPPPVPRLVGPPPDAPARRGSVPLPQRGFVLDEASKAAAREAAGAARAARAAAQVTTAPVAYAVAAPRVRSQAESELMRAALQAAVTQASPAPGCRVEALPVADDWRVVCWPFLHRKDAERLHQQLTARGHRLEVIDF